MARLLVVDDDPDLLILLDAHFSVRGHKVSIAESCEAAIGLLALARPDAILLDFCLPKMDGARFLEILRGDPLTKDVPVVVMSAASPSWITTRMPADPLVRVIDKPFDFAELDPLIEDMIPARPAA